MAIIEANHRGIMGRPTVPPQLGIRSVIENWHDRAITNRENTASHHKLIVCQWSLFDILHRHTGRHRETIKTPK